MRGKKYILICIVSSILLLSFLGYVVKGDEKEAYAIRFQQVMPLEKLDEGIYVIEIGKSSIAGFSHKLCLYDESDDEDDGELEVGKYEDSDKRFLWKFKYIKNTGPDGKNEWDKDKTEYLYEIYNVATNRKLVSENLGGELELELKSNYDKEYTFGFGTGKNLSGGIPSKKNYYYIIDGVQRNSVLYIEDDDDDYEVENSKYANLHHISCQFKLTKIEDENKEMCNLNVKTFKADEECKEGIFPIMQKKHNELLECNIVLEKDGKKTELVMKENVGVAERLIKGTYNISVKCNGYKEIIGTVNLKENNENLYIYMEEIDNKPPNADIATKYYGDGKVDAILTNYSEPVYVIGCEVTFNDGQVKKILIDENKIKLIRRDDISIKYSGINKNCTIKYLIEDKAGNKSYIEKEIIVGSDKEITSIKQDR